MEVKIANILLENLLSNTGQIVGLPKNPRIIKDYRFNQLVKSIEDDPDFLEIRELVVYPFGNKFVVIAGNQRLMALQKLKFKQTQCKILPTEIPVEKLQAFAIKDNINFGLPDWDILANEWDDQKLVEWGLEMPFFDNELAKKVNIQNEWIGMPEYDPGAKVISLNISFVNEQDRDEFCKKFKIKLRKHEIGSLTWSAWWPDKERNDIQSIKFVKEDAE
jgi:hypothetical protein